MILSAESQKAIDTYLAALRKQLRPLRPEDANDIVEEIHAHILDKSAGLTAEDAVSSTLAALGTPRNSPPVIAPTSSSSAPNPPVRRSSVSSASRAGRRSASSAW